MIVASVFCFLQSNAVYYCVIKPVFGFDYLGLWKGGLVCCECFPGACCVAEPLASCWQHTCLCLNSTETHTMLKTTKAPRRWKIQIKMARKSFPVFMSGTRPFSRLLE